MGEADTMTFTILTYAVQVNSWAAVCQETGKRVEQINDDPGCTFEVMIDAVLREIYSPIELDQLIEDMATRALSRQLRRSGLICDEDKVIIPGSPKLVDTGRKD